MTSSLIILPNATFFVELAALLLMIWVVSKYATGPVKKIIEIRQEKVRNMLEEANQAKEQSEALLARRNEELDRAKTDARKIIEQANKTAASIVEESRTKAEEERQRLMESARIEINAEISRAKAEISAQFGSAVIEAAEKIMGREIDEQKHRDLISKTIQSLDSESVDA
jgi:F-type H+-transporting ATPase subunit b